VQIASIPDDIRGFGHIKMRNINAARKKHAELLERFESTQAARAAA
jgi:indolepyruvate ferredoxin oxidoreductase